MYRKIALLLLTAILAIQFEACGIKNKTLKTTGETTEIISVTETVVATTEPIIPEGEGVGEIPGIAEETIWPNIPEESAPKSDTPEPTKPNTTTSKPTEQETIKPTATEPTMPDFAEVTKPEETPEHTEALKPTEPPVSSSPCCEYDKYLSMSPAEQEAYMRTFSNPLEFIQWSQDAEAEHKAHDDTIVVEGGDLNIGDFME